MKRMVKRASTRPLAWALGLAIPLGLLIGVLALASPKRLTAKWPFGIQGSEVREFARLKGIVMEDKRTAPVAVLRLGAGQRPCILDSSDGGWRTTWFEADGYGDDVQLTHGEHGMIMLRFKQEAPFNAQREIHLVPATVASIRAKYLEILAAELELPVPEVSFVRLIACGRDLGVHLKEEALDRNFLAKRRLTDATLFRTGADPSCPQGMFPNAVSDTVMDPELRALWSGLHAGLLQGKADGLHSRLDQEGAVAWLLMRWLEDGDQPACSTIPYMHRKTTGTIAPLFERAVVSPTGLRSGSTMDPMTALLEDGAVREALKAKREALNEVRWRMKERFSAMQRAWLPVLAEEGDLAWAGAIAERIAEELLDVRLATGDPIAYHQQRWMAGPGRATFVGSAALAGPVLVQTIDGTIPLERIAARFRTATIQGDTLVFGRGKYGIDDAIVLPAGKTLVIEKGARLSIAPGGGITVQGSLHVRGTKLNPVFVRPADDARPFGAIKVRGDGHATCRVAGLMISGGGTGEAMLSIQGASEVRFADCEFGTAPARVVEVSGGHCAFDRCTFLGGTGPLLVLDHARSEVRMCMFQSGRGMNAGTGILVAGERALLEKCTLTGMVGAALMVRDAAQVLAKDNVFQRNATAMEVMDLALVHVAGNTFAGNALVFALKREDPVQGGGRVLLYTNDFSGNEQERKVDEYSSIEAQDKLDPKVLSDFGAR